MTHPRKSRDAMVEAITHAVTELERRAYVAGLREGLSDLRTVRLNLKPQYRRALPGFLDTCIARLEERIGDEPSE